VTAAAACAALISAINGDASAVVTAAAGTGDKVVVTAKSYGLAANGIATAETCTNASWGGATLSGGTVTGTDVAIYSPMAPPQSGKPYVILGDDLFSDWSTKTSYGVEGVLTFHVWDLATNATRCDLIFSAICARLVDESLTVSGHTILRIWYAGDTKLVDEDPALGPATHGLLRLRTLIAQTT
jgi:hypothetical protein